VNYVLDAKLSAERIEEGDSIKFTDLSSPDPQSRSWRFEKGGPISSAEDTISVSYTEAGVYDVDLTVNWAEKTMAEEWRDRVKVGCSGLYCEPTFTSVTKTSNVVYGVDSSQQYMHVYEPTNDTRTERPVVILMGGGGFQGSNLDLLDELCRNLASYGVVAASARFRNGSSHNQQAAFATFINGQQDVHAAVRYFRREAALWKIDTTAVFSGGNGTGGFISFFQAMMDEADLDQQALSAIQALGGLEGQQGSPGHSSAVAGVLVLAGGSYDNIDFMDSNDPPVYAIHGTLDQEVPYEQGVNSGGSKVFGGRAITDKAREIGLKNEMYTLENMGHDGPRSKSDDYIEELMWFIRSIIR
jgi:PKD repeat protein